ncbi:MAG: BTAD domain-containing putative transcriptional regulator [Egibacteraceae bacterium]
MSPQPPPIDGLALRVLGPVTLRRGGHACDLGPRPQRCLLARLLLDANRPVGAQRLVTDLWPGVPADRAATVLRETADGLSVLLDRHRPLRSPPAVLVTEQSGYALQVPPESVDVVRFRALAADVAELLAAGEVSRAHRAGDAALWLWEGPALVDVRDRPFAVAAAADLEEQRLAVQERGVAAAIALGLTGQAAAELEQLAAHGPLREGFWEALVTALAACGRPAVEAAARFQDVRCLLDADLQLGSGPGRAALERRVAGRCARER